MREVPSSNLGSPRQFFFFFAGTIQRMRDWNTCVSIGGSGHVSRHSVHHVCTRDGNAWQLLQNARIPRLASVASILFLFPVLDALGRSCPLTHRKIRTPSDDPSGWVVWACRPASRHFPKPKSVDAALRVATAKDSKGFLPVGALSQYARATSATRSTVFQE